MRSLEENVGSTLQHIGKGNFLNRTNETQDIMPKVNKWDNIKLKVSAQQRKQSTEQRVNISH